MKLAIFGATGPTGQQLTKQALEQGHEVTALVRSPGKLGLHHDRLKVVRGSALNAGSVESVVLEQDAVLSALGSRERGKDEIYSQGYNNIVQAMKAHNVRRFITVTAAGVEDDPALGFIFGTLFTKVLLKGVYDDMRRGENILRRSGLDWTVVRPGGLQDKPRTGKYRVQERFLPKGGRTIARADVADFMLKELAANKYVQKAVAIVY